ncbi:Tetratricopeptide repeat protein 19 homolog, mitochondrial [Gryllus bimaculatus]|nr:Tetratricopeptide repeat protein 19 homolog, mitochondrial [Gryllus bimaculatus]
MSRMIRILSNRLPRLQKEEEPESVLITTMKRGVLLIQQGELQKSEQMLHIALKLAQEQQNSDAITYIYDLLANVALEAHDLPKAEKLFVTVLQRLLSAGCAEDDNKVLHISLKLASIYKEKGNKIKAEEGFKFCENHLQKKVERGSVDDDTLLLWAMTLDWYARFAMDQNRFKEAFAFFEKAYETSLRVNGLVHEQNVILLNDLGTLCCLQNNYDEAIKYLNQAIDITKKIPDMEEAAAVYVNLGTVYMKRKMFEEAKQACKEGWRNAKQKNDKETLEEANLCLEELKTLYAAQGANT